MKHSKVSFHHLHQKIRIRSYELLLQSNIAQRLLKNSVALMNTSLPFSIKVISFFISDSLAKNLPVITMIGLVSIVNGKRIPVTRLLSIGIDGCSGKRYFRFLIGYIGAIRNFILPSQGDSFIELSFSIIVR